MRMGHRIRSYVDSFADVVLAVRRGCVIPRLFRLGIDPLKRGLSTVPVGGQVLKRCCPNKTAKRSALARLGEE